MRWLDDITDSMDMSLTMLLEMAKDWEAWRAAVHGGRKELDMTEQLKNTTHNIESNRPHLKSMDCRC